MSERMRAIGVYSGAGLSVLLAFILALQALHVAGARLGAFRVGRQIAASEMKSAEDTSAPPKPVNPGPPPGPTPGQKPGSPESEFAAVFTRGLFSKVEKKPEVVPVCMGVLGKQAIFDQGVAGVGGMVAGWKVVEVRVEKVTIEKDGKKRELEIFPELKMAPAEKKPGEKPGPPTMGPPSGGSSPGVPSGGRPPDMARREGPSGRGRMPAGLPPEVLKEIEARRAARGGGSSEGRLR